QHEIQQVFLIRNVPVQRHRARTKLRGEATHGKLLQALGVRQLDGGADDLFARERRALALRLPRGAHPDWLAPARLVFRVRWPMVLPAMRRPLMPPDRLLLDRLALVIGPIL